MDIDGYLRRQLLERIYEKMSDDEKRLFVQLTMQRKSAAEIMSALQLQSAKIDRLQKTQQTFGEDLTSNIIGNAAWDGLLWLARRLFK
ncbi:MAG: hypothetical protein IJ615_10690 [Bacteroidaceae bacterium]|nr:hypothetical protein [Bacteroidaceae bacterium]